MGKGECGRSDSSELQETLTELEETASTAHAELCAELSGDQSLDPSREETEELRGTIETTRQYIRQLEQYIVALEELVDEGE
jgi:hypothetical protein